MRCKRREVAVGIFSNSCPSFQFVVVLKIPSSYPLNSVTVEMPHKMGVAEALLRKWLLSMTTLLLTRDGTVLDAVLLWKGFLDKHFDGVDVCPICYSIFHISNHALPNLGCKTCRNKFHSACLVRLPEFAVS